LPEIRITKHLPCGIPPSAGPHCGIPQGEHETNPKSQFSNVQNIGKKIAFRRFGDLKILSDFVFPPTRTSDWMIEWQWKVNDHDNQNLSEDRKAHLGNLGTDPNCWTYQRRCREITGQPANLLQG
jgi:hypothetical protein